MIKVFLFGCTGQRANDGGNLLVPGESGRDLLPSEAVSIFPPFDTIQSKD